MRVVTFAKNKFETLCSLFWILTIFKVALIASQWKHEIVDPFMGMEQCYCPPHCDITKYACPMNDCSKKKYECIFSTSY